MSPTSGFHTGQETNKQTNKQIDKEQTNQQTNNQHHSYKCLRHQGFLQVNNNDGSNRFVKFLKDLV